MGYHLSFLRGSCIPADRLVMAVYHWRLYPVNKKKVFFVSIYRAGKGTGEYLPGQYLTIGKEPDCEINPIPGFPERHRLIESSGKGYNLIIPSNLEGAITRGNISLPLNGIIEFGFLKKKRKKIDRALKKPLINREDYSFFTILIITIIINFSMATYLNSLEIKKKEDPLEAIKRMPQRFAKLILQPPKPRTSKAKAEEPVKEKEKETKKDNEKKVESSKEVEPPKDIERKTEPQEVAMIPPSEGISAISAREQIREKVKTKGLLGVIMAKAMPEETSGGIVLRDVENIVTSLEKGGSSYNKGKESSGGGEDIISSPNVLEDLSKKIIEKQPEIKPKDTSDIIAEKKEITVAKLKSEDAFPSASKKRDEAEVYRVVGSYVGGLKYLYNNALRKNPSLKGKITVKVVISADGKVVKAEVISSTLDFSELEEAIISRIYRWRFSEIKDIGDFAIDYTFDFAPVS